MTGRPRPAPPRHAARVLVVYWLTVLGGLALFTATHTSDAGLTTRSLWIGAIGGTLLGHHLALKRFRLWIAAVTIAGVGAYLWPLFALGDDTAPLWLTYVPAALCAFWSLGDRSGLAAAWFPVVIWMLGILDRSDQLAPDGAAAVLLGALAALFLALLAARESRRVALWRSVAARPLAAARPAELLREPPGHPLGRAVWWLTVGALTVAITVWLVPPLWRSEALAGDPAALADDPNDDPGPPCCPLRRDADTQSTRIKEYLGIGLGHDPHAATLRDGIDCRVCPDAAPGTFADARPGRTRGGGSTSGVPAPPSVGVVIDMSGPPRPPPPPAPVLPATFTGRGGYLPPALNTPIPSSIADGRAPSVVADSRTPSAVADSRAPSADAPSADAPSPTPTTAADNRTPSADLPKPAADLPKPSAAPSASAQDVSPVPAPPPAAASGPPPRAGPAGHPTRAQRAIASPLSAPLLHWLLFAVVGAGAFQVVRLALRPLRRLVTLRHLRRPFWDETIDQRISNAWQLALVGLRDAGWRTRASEAPCGLARRVGVDGLDRCATILERARHGVGLDAGDLDEMQRSADAAYRAARTATAPLTRALGWLRWPLT